MNEERYERIKASLAMWMHDSLESMLTVGNYNYEKLGIKKFDQSEIIDMGIAIFNKRVDLEMLKAGDGE